MLIPRTRSIWQFGQCSKEKVFSSIDVFPYSANKIKLKEIHAQKCKQKHNYLQFKFKSNRALLHSWIGFNFLVLPTITAPPTWPSSSPSFPSITITTSSYNNNNIELFHISELLYKVLTSCKAGMISCKISSKLNFNLRCSPIFRSI